jgi:hypothetical protein
VRKFESVVLVMLIQINLGLPHITWFLLILILLSFNWFHLNLPVWPPLPRHLWSIHGACPSTLRSTWLWCGPTRPVLCWQHQRWHMQPVQSA